MTAKASDWFVYILCCADKTLYTGITTDVDRRLLEHNAEKSITKYTRVRQPVTMVYTEQTESRSTAGQREAQIKSLTRKQKKALIKQHSLIKKTKKAKPKKAVIKTKTDTKT